MSTWDADNVPFPASTRAQCRSYCNCTTVEDLIHIIVCHYYMKEKKILTCFCSKSFVVQGKEQWPIPQPLPSGVHKIHNLNAYVVNHLYHKKKPSFTVSSYLYDSTQLEITCPYHIPHSREECVGPSFWFIRQKQMARRYGPLIDFLHLCIVIFNTVLVSRQL